MKGSNAYVDVDMHECYFCFVGPRDIEDIKGATESDCKKKIDELINIKKMQISCLWKMIHLK
jgi:hypothetical protein